jgi:hypothetical protein
MTAWEGRERATSRSRPRTSWLDWLFPEKDKSDRGRAVPHKASIRRDRGGWSVTLPVREEKVDVYRRAFTVETVRLRVQRQNAVAGVHDSLQREELVVDPDEGLDVTREDASSRGEAANRRKPRRQ